MSAHVPARRKPPIPDDEAARLEALRRYRILDTAPEHALDDITRLVALICRVPIATITLVDSHRQWFKSTLGTDAKETSRDDAFCAHTIAFRATMVVNDATADPRFSSHPTVLGEPGIRFYAGAPLLTPEGFAIGSLCAIDRQPRGLEPEQKAALESLARLVMMQLELKRNAAELAEACANVRTLTGLLPICASCKDVRDDKGYWSSVETYIASRTPAEFTHGICLKCAERLYPGIDFRGLT